MIQTMEKDPFIKNFVISTGVHAVLFVLAFGVGKFISGSSVDQGKIEVITSSVRVDVVGMPKFTVEELKAMQSQVQEKAQVEAKGAPEEVKPTVDEAEDVIKKDDIVIQEKSNDAPKKPSFMNIVSDYSAKKVKAAPKKKGSTQGSNKSLDSLVLEGNKLSKGGALVGDYSDGEVSEMAEYVQALPELVRVHFKLPSYLMDQNLRCRIAVYIGNTGEVLKTQLIESSGNPEYDARAEKSIRAAAPFPKPSSTLSPRLGGSGVILRFPL